MKKLSEFEGVEGVEKAAEVMEEITEISANEKNTVDNNDSLIKMYTMFMKNNPRNMMNIFAILSDEDPKEYTCNGAEAVQNMYFLISDRLVNTLFISQVRKTGATSSGPASQKAKQKT